MISVVILAAGESRRMNEPKLFMPLGGSTILGQTVDNFLKSKVDEVIVVVGAHAEQAIALLDKRQIKLVFNPHYKLGIGTSISIGVRLASLRSEGVMLALADQPYITSQTVDHLVDVFLTHAKDIVVPLYQGRRGHPVLFAQRYYTELLLLKGDVGGKKLLTHHPEDVYEVPVDCAGVCIDIDTPYDYVTWSHKGQS